MTLAGEAVRRAPARIAQPRAAGRDRHGSGLGDRGQRPAARARRGRRVPLRDRRRARLRAPRRPVRDGARSRHGRLAQRRHRLHSAGVRLEGGRRDRGPIAARAADAWNGALDGSAGSDARRRVLVVVRRAAATRAVAHARRQPPVVRRAFSIPSIPTTCTTTGGASSGGGQFGWTPAAADVLTVVAAATALDASTSRTARIRRRPAGSARSASARRRQTRRGSAPGRRRTVSQLAGYHRCGSSTLDGEHAVDTPLFTHADRTLRRLGVLGSVSHQARAASDQGRRRSVVAARCARTSRSPSPTRTRRRRPASATRRSTSRSTIRSASAARDAVAVLGLRAGHASGVSTALTIDAGVRVDWSRLLAARVAGESARRRRVSLRRDCDDACAPRSAGSSSRRSPRTCCSSSSDGGLGAVAVRGATTGGGADARARTPDGASKSASSTRARPVVAHRRRVLARGDARRRRPERLLRHDDHVSELRSPKGRAAGIDVRARGAAHARLVGVRQLRERRASSSTVRSTAGCSSRTKSIEIGPGTAFTPDHDQRNVGAFGVLVRCRARAVCRGRRHRPLRKRHAARSG